MPQLIAIGLIGGVKPKQFWNKTKTVFIARWMMN